MFYSFIFEAFGILTLHDWYMVTDVSEQRIVSILMGRVV
jgi:hypothetical protein